jgi:non-specific serine/threonine protein kinase
MASPLPRYPESSALPHRPSSFIGRAREIETVVGLVASHPLVTLAGAPGVGKTRLGLRAATELQSRFRDGVVFVELAGLTEPELVPGYIATALGIQERGDQSIVAELAEALRGRELLLALDNCEHLIEACAAVVESLLRACPSLRCLATSREALRCEGELVWRVPSLSAPDASEGLTGGDTGFDGLPRYEAVQLFVERAQAVRPAFALTERTAPEVARICARLDGIPLAIELAAARVAHLSVQQIAARLDNHLRLLTGGARTAPPRQQTLEATIAWSYDLLPRSEQALLRHLSVFAGGWTLDASEAAGDTRRPHGRVSGGDHAVPPARDSTAVDLLARLVDKSLVQVEDGVDGEPRYRCLEMIRQYAFERLAEAGEADDARRRHAEYYVALAETADACIWGPEYRAWFSRLDAEHDNLRAALLYAALAPATVTLGVHGLAALWWFWMIRGHHSDALYLSEQILASVKAASLPNDAVPQLARAVIGAASAALHLNQFARSEQLFEQSLDVAMGVDDREATAWALVFFGRLRRGQRDYDGAVRLMNQSRERFSQLGDPRGTAMVLYQLGAVAWQRADFDRATTLLHESLAVFRQVGGRLGETMLLEFVARAAYNQGRYEEAVAGAEEHLALSRDIGYRWGIGFSLTTLGMVAHRRGELARAAALLQESLAIRRDMGERDGIAECLELLAGVARSLGNAHSAARLLGVAEALRDLIAAPIPLASRSDYERELSAVRAALDDATFARCWSEGRAMPLEQGIDEARALGRRTDAPVPPTPPQSGRPTAPGAHPPDLLTSREREVAALIALGLSNGEAAARLVVSKRTVDAHMASILAKLGFANRAQVAVWAAAQGLPADTGGVT